MSKEPKKKILKTNKADDVKTVPTPDIFQDAGVLRHVLSFILSIDEENDWPESRERRQLVQDSGTFRSVSKAWHDTTWEMMSHSAPTDVVSVKQLSKIKARVAALDLSSLTDGFLKEVRTRWGHHGNQVLDSIFEHFGPTPQQFAKRVSYEYKRMLVVKAVETAAAGKGIPAWTEKCQPNMLVDMFWHTHMLSPRKYAADCTSVIGEIIDHDGGYNSRNEFTGSDYVSKRDLLFKFEQEHFPEVDFFDGRLGNDGEGTARTMLFDNKFAFAALAIIMQDMDGFNDCG